MRTPSPRRTGITAFIAGCSRGANRNAKPCASSRAPSRSGSRSSGTPSASSTSAEPQRDDTERLPCLATAAPQAAATSAAPVEMLSVCAPSPPVPQVSISGRRRVSTGTATRRSTRAAAATSAGASPLARSATRNAACCASVHSPPISASKHASVVAASRSCLASRRSSTSRIMARSRPGDRGPRNRGPRPIRRSRGSATERAEPPSARTRGPRGRMTASSRDNGEAVIPRRAQPDEGPRGAGSATATAPDTAGAFIVFPPDP